MLVQRMLPTKSVSLDIAWSFMFPAHQRSPHPHRPVPAPPWTEKEQPRLRRCPGNKTSWCSGWPLHHLHDWREIWACHNQMALLCLGLGTPLRRWCPKCTSRNAPAASHLLSKATGFGRTPGQCACFRMKMLPLGMNLLTLLHNWYSIFLLGFNWAWYCRN